VVATSVVVVAAVPASGRGHGVGASLSSALSADDTCQGSLPSSPNAPAPSRIVFGIYPGGPAGAVLPVSGTVPEDPAARMAAVDELRGSPGRPFVVRLYLAYTGDAAQGPEVAGVISEAQSFTSAGYLVRPAGPSCRRADSDSAAGRGSATSPPSKAASRTTV